jgi:hypothetical protein
MNFLQKLMFWRNGDPAETADPLPNGGPNAMTQAERLDDEQAKEDREEFVDEQAKAEREAFIREQEGRVDEGKDQGGPYGLD